MIESLLEKIRSDVASTAVKAANTVLRKRIAEDSARGTAALNVSLRRFAAYPRLQREIIRRIIYRPPAFALARDNSLRQVAPNLLSMLIKARQALAGFDGTSQIVAEIDSMLGESRE